MQTTDPHSPKPRHEGGGDKLLIGVAVVIATGLGGAMLSFLLRQYTDPPPIAVHHVPPSARLPGEAAVPAAPTFAPPAQK